MDGISGQFHESGNGVLLLENSWHQANNFLFKVKLLQSGVDILLTDAHFLWHTTLTKEDIVSLAKSQNTAMEASNECFFTASIDLLCHHSNNLTCQSSNDGKTATCLFKTSLQDFAFSLSVELTLASVEQYYREITVPLLASIHHIQCDQEELIKLIQRKDEEITEYKLMGGTLTRKGIATKYFKKDEFLKASKTRDTTKEIEFQADDVCRHTLTSYCQIRVKYEKKEEETKPSIKTEPKPSSAPAKSLAPMKRASIPEPPVLNLPKRPRSGKLARLI